MAVRFLLLRCWVGLVGVIAVVNALQCYWDPGYTSRRIYTLDPKQAGPLFTRMFGNWTLLAGLLRVIFAATPDSMGLYFVTLFSFVLACLHFIVETTVTRTAPLTFATIAPLVISSVSILWMLMCWSDAKTATKNNNHGGAQTNYYINIS